MVDGNVRYHGIYYLSSLYVMYQMNVCSCLISNQLFAVLGDFFHVRAYLQIGTLNSEIAK